MLKVAEMFTSIQGEGKFVGAPSFFIRLAGCNLRCEWCDTKYSWSKGKNLPESEIMKKVPNWIKHVVITGGEPLLQPIENLVSGLKTKFITVETNGTIVRKIPTEDVNLWVISPKPQFKYNHQINYYSANTRERLWKFVVGDENDVRWCLRFLKEYGLDPDSEEIFFQPKYELNISDKEYYLDLARIISKYVVRRKLNIRTVPQLHKLLKLR